VQWGKIHALHANICDYSLHHELHANICDYSLHHQSSLSAEWHNMIFIHLNEIVGILQPIDADHVQRDVHVQVEKLSPNPKHFVILRSPLTPPHSLAVHDEQSTGAGLSSQAETSGKRYLGKEELWYASCAS